MKFQLLVSWILRLIASFIMLQTLFFKFSASEESVYIFSTLGIEPWGRIGTGIAELISAVLLLWPRTVSIGALMGVGIMSGALLSHLTVLGIEVKNDNGYLFYLCLTVLISCVLLLFIHRQQFQLFVTKLRGTKRQKVLSP